MARPDSTRPRIWPMRRMPKLRVTVLGTFVVAASLSLLCAGCAHNQAHAATPVTVPPTPPAPVPSQDTTKSPASIPAPNTPAPANPVPTTAPPALNPKPETPKRPVTTAPATSDEADHPAAPQISPQISASDQSQLQQQAGQYVATAQQNLHHADGRDLNDAQKDMVDKIRGFLDQAQQAIQTSDWERAKNLSQKAYLLSLDLLKTL
jgi:cell pole-organizing protein PopZ